MLMWIYLYDHFLSSNSSVGESQLVASAARIWSIESGKSVSQIVVYNNRLVVVADERRATIAPALCIFICNGFAILVAAIRILTKCHICGPTTARLAAVPVTSGSAY